ncbi:putative leucine-rich repeat-containing protein DDB_G0290503 [Physella acuta]|uniref:putative leucine-rich repeat-containing protein DDB_G0290503 n=1 Tax=Physella acuta TaxID=109671 RepID=UPI0027DB6436|nr:putative leucine-rich repeat-containing protein DDB_G0290503 [Physella acuta]
MSDTNMQSVLDAIEKQKDEINTLKANRDSFDETLMALKIALRNVKESEKKRYEKMKRQTLFYVEKQNISTKVLGHVLQNYLRLNQRLEEVTKKQHEFFSSFKEECNEMNNKIKTQDTKIDNVKVELSTSQLESLARCNSLEKQLDSKITTEAMTRREEVKNVAFDITLLKGINRTKDTKLEELSKKNNDLAEKMKNKFDELMKEAHGIEERSQQDVKNLHASINEINSKLNEHDGTIKEQQAKTVELNSTFLVSLSMTASSLNSQLQELDNKVQKEKKNVHDEYNTLRSLILMIKDTHETRFSNLADLTKKNDEDQKALQSSVNKLYSRMHEQDETVKGLQLNIEELNASFFLSLSETDSRFNSQLQQLDNKIQKEKQNVHEEYNTVRSDIQLIKVGNQTRDSKLMELDQDQKTLQVSVNQLSLKGIDMRNDTKRIKQRMTTMEDLIASVSEQQNMFISNVTERCNKLDDQLKDQEKKFDSVKAEVSISFSNASAELNSQFQLIDNKITTETKNLHEVINNLRRDTLLIEDTNSNRDSKLQELTSKTDDITKQMKNMNGELDQTIKAFDNRCLHAIEILQGEVFDLETNVKDLGNCNTETKQKQTTMDEQITSMYSRLDKLQQDGDNFRQFRDLANRKLLNIKVTCDTLEGKLTAEGKNVEELKRKLQVLSKSVSDSSAVMTCHLTKLDGVIKREIQNRSNEICSLKCEMQAMEKEHQKGNSKVVDLYLKYNAQENESKNLRDAIDELDSARKMLEHRCQQFHTRYKVRM